MFKCTQSIMAQTCTKSHTQADATLRFPTIVQRRVSEADARGYMYLLKQQGVGAGSAVLQHQWASLEAGSGAAATLCE